MPHTRINSKWIKDFNVRPKTIKILEENMGSKLQDIANSNILSDISPQARETKGKKNKNKWGYVKLKSVCTPKETINKIKDNPWNGRTYPSIHLTRGYDPKFIKNLQNQNQKSKQSN